MNKLIVIGVVFILIFTLNLTLHDSHASSSSIYQVPFNIVNTQNVSTPNPFQQLIELSISKINQYMITLNSNARIIYNGQYGLINGYGSGTFANFEFSYPNGQIIPSWIEENNSGVLLIWLKLSSIQAYGSITIYLDIFPSNDNLLSASGTFGIGENPRLSPIYGEYDDGASVFDFYDNFSGNTLNGNNWVYGGSGSITINNYIYLKSNGYIYIITRRGFNPQETIADVFASQSPPSTYVSFSMTIGQNNISGGYFWLSDGYDPYGYGSYAKGVVFVGNGNGFGSGNVQSESWQINNKHVYIMDYGYSTSYSNQSFNYYSTPSIIYYGIGIVYNFNTYVNVTWFDVRAYPPNGVMPSVSPGVVVSVSYPSNNQNSNNQNISVYNATSENLQFNSQYFSFVIDPLFIFSLLIFLSLIFVIFMAIAVVKKRR